MVRSIHLYLQFCDVNWMPRYKKGKPDLEKILKSLPQSLPNLQRLSIFIQGPITNYRTYSEVVSRITDVCYKLKSLKQVTVRLPRDNNYSYKGRPRHVAKVKQEIKTLLDDPDTPFTIVQPYYNTEQRCGDQADRETEYDCAWRIGTLYLGDERNSAVTETVNYAVFTEASDK